jgi:hypothetical protein
MNLRSATYIAAREVRVGLLDNEDGVEAEYWCDNWYEQWFWAWFWFDDDEFDPILGAHDEAADDSMEVDEVWERRGSIIRFIGFVEEITDGRAYVYIWFITIIIHIIQYLESTSNCS